MMAELSLTVFDIAVLFVIGVSGLLALVRGLVREGLSVVVWILSALVAYVAFPELRMLVADYIPNVWIGDAVTLVIVFLAPLVCLKIVAMVIADSVPSGLFGSFDRILGAGYGVVRGALIVSLAYLGLNLVNEPEHHPVWIKDAKVLPYVRDGAEFLAAIAPETILSTDLWQALPDGSLGGRPAVAETLPSPVDGDVDGAADIDPTASDQP